MGVWIDDGEFGMDLLGCLVVLLGGEEGTEGALL